MKIVQEFIAYFKDKKNLINLLVLAIAVLAIPLGVNLIRQQQILQSRAGGGAIAFTGENVRQRGNQWQALASQITLELTSDLGPPAGSGGIPPPGASPSPPAACKTEEQVAKEILDKFPDVRVFILDNTGWPDSTPSLKIVQEWIKIGPQDPNAQQAKRDLDAAAVCKSANKKGLIKEVYAAGCTGTPSGISPDQWRQKDDSVWYACVNPVRGACAADACGGRAYLCTDGQWQPYPGNAGTLGECTTVCAGFCIGVPPRPSPQPSQPTQRSPLPTQPPSNGGSCSVGQWALQPQEPIAPNTSFKALIKGGTSTNNDWSNIGLKYDGNNVGIADIKTDGSLGSLSCSSAQPCFGSSTLNSGSAGSSHTLVFSTRNGTACSNPKNFTTSSGPLPSPSPSSLTVSFRVAQSKNDLESAEWQEYSEVPMEVPFEFEDQTPGPKQVWVEFKAVNNSTSRHFANIKLLGEDPAITGCSLSFEGQNVVFDIRGTNFGKDKGSVKSGEQNLQIREWKDGSMKLVWPNAPVGQSFPIIVTNADGQAGEGQCAAASTISLGAKVFCRSPSRHDTEEVEVILAGAFEGGKKVKEIVKIDRNGSIRNLTQKLEEGKDYKISVKAPRSLRRVSEFTASSGTTNISNFSLPVGDIFPADGGDGTINSLDKAELNRQWIIGQSVSGRSGDFNLDDRVNSIDWACMRFDFGQSDALEPAPGAPAPSPSPSASPEASPSASPRPSGIVCAQVITPAKDPKTGECKNFATPCDVPDGWQIVDSCSTNELWKI